MSDEPATLLDHAAALRALQKRIDHYLKHVDFSSDDAMEFLVELAGKTAAAIDRVDDAVRDMNEAIAELRAKFLGGEK